MASPSLIQLCEILLKNLSQQHIISHCVIANKYKLVTQQLTSLADYIYDDNDIAAKIASGSFKTEGLIILGYSEDLIFEINSGITKSLCARAADVVLKERRRLVYAIEKTPWDGNMVQEFVDLTALGGIICPLVPAFYNHPDSVEEMLHHACARMMDLFAFDVQTKRWRDN